MWGDAKGFYKYSIYALVHRRNVVGTCAIAFLSENTLMNVMECVILLNLYAGIN